MSARQGILLMHSRVWLLAVHIFFMHSTTYCSWSSAMRLGLMKGITPAQCSWLGSVSQAGHAIDQGRYASVVVLAVLVYGAAQYWAVA